MRIVNGLIAGWLGYLGAGLLFNGAEALGVAAGFGVLSYLLPRLGSLGVIVALAVTQVMSQQAGLGFAAFLPAVGGLWVAVGSASQDMSRLPLGPLLAIPFAAADLGAGLPLFFGALMGPLGAALSAAAGAYALVFYDLSYFGDGVIPYLGLSLGNLLPRSLGPVQLLQQGELLVRTYHAFSMLAVLWAAMGLLVAAAERFGRWVLGLGLAVVVGVLGYVLAVSATSEARLEAMTSLGLAAIMYGAVRYLISRVSR